MTGGFDPDEITWRLMHCDMKLRPWEIDRLSLDEIALALDEDTSKKRRSRRSTLAGHASLQSYVIWLQSLTAQQRLELARYGEVKSGIQQHPR